MSRVFDRPRLVLAALLVLGGCSLNRDPFDAPGTWRPAGANDQNLRAMVATPSDLERGVGAATERGQAGAYAATRLFVDRRRRLPPLSTLSTAATAPTGGDAPVAGPGGGSGAGR
ncbi:hypothetical protein [Caldovatus aquaticus]|uniref:Uncharacterized protein n=1 Tax=Caldovatus aquaticus TaxID=2865671 RepID=A0ABS7F194_9PROT|nr:hypothetical protein [Caldovatus aquaticus]MBW8269083.1 hypothetical protein [Caldovatus aquaticus]